MVGVERGLMVGVERGLMVGVERGLMVGVGVSGILHEMWTDRCGAFSH